MGKNIIFVAILTLTLFSGCKMFQNWFSKKNIIETQTAINVFEITSKEQFNDKIINSKIPTIVKFETIWCGACKQFTPTYNKASEQFKDQVQFNTVDADKLGDIANEYEIRGVPSFLLFKDGKLIEKIEGGMSESELIKKIETFLEK